MHPILYLKNVAPRLFFGPSIWFLAPLLPNPGDGPASESPRVSDFSPHVLFLQLVDIECVISQKL